MIHAYMPNNLLLNGISDTQYGGKFPYSCPCYLFVKLTLKIYLNNLGQAFYLAKK